MDRFAGKGAEISQGFVPNAGQVENATGLTTTGSGSFDALTSRYQGVVRADVSYQIDPQSSTPEGIRYAAVGILSAKSLDRIISLYEERNWTVETYGEYTILTSPITGSATPPGVSMDILRPAHGYVVRGACTWERSSAPADGVLDSLRTCATAMNDFGVANPV